MMIELRPIESADTPFLREMLYEAVYWRSIAEGTNPPFDEALPPSPGIGKAVEQLGDWEGDAGVIALVDSARAGAAWYRFWADDNYIRGHISEGIPTLVLAVHGDFRRQGIGRKMLDRLIKHAAQQEIERMSLMVSKDNHALHLYRACGFEIHADDGDSLLMLREI